MPISDRNVLRLKLRHFVYGKQITA